MKSDHPDEVTLDPTDWTGFRELAHQVLDDAIDFLKEVRDRPVWVPVPEDIRARFSSPLPREGTPLLDVYQEFSSAILPYSAGNIHPRFFGWVQGSGQAGNIVAEILSSVMNSNCGGRDHGAIYVERQVIDWGKQLFGFPESASGLLVSGTSLATLTALTVARQSFDSRVRLEGFDAKATKLTVYASSEVHECVPKALESLGLGSASLRKISVGPSFAIDLEELKQTIESDRCNGMEPFCCIGCAGTVNTGAIDDLQAISEICRQEQIWFHVDGAFGGLCMMSDRLRTRLNGIENCDSLSFDFHKWAHVQYDAGCVLVKEASVHRETFAMRPDYLTRLTGGLGGGDDWPCDYGIELSRSFRALKIWFALKEHGTKKFGDLIEQNCAQAAYLAERISTLPQLKLMAPTTLNIVCFRVLGNGMTEHEVDQMNESIVIRLQLSGKVVVSTTRINSRTSIRVNLTNHRTRYDDLDFLVDEVLKP